MLKALDRAVTWLAMHLFPAPHPMGTILGREIDSVDVALAIYTLCIGVGLALVFGNWLWFPATLLCMVMAAMMYRMLWGD